MLMQLRPAKCVWKTHSVFMKTLSC